MEEMRPLPHHSSSGTGYRTYTYYLAQIIDCIQQFFDSDEYTEEQIAAEIAMRTQDHIQLYLLRQSTSSRVMISYVTGRRGFLVRWGDEIYGSLQVKLIGEAQDQHILPVVFCERLAQDCGWGLHILEKEAQRRQQKQKSKAEAVKKISSLSPAQYTVLELMMKGFSTQEIAEKLHLSKRTIESHQRNIYQMLDVHSQREAILTGLAAGLITF